MQATFQCSQCGDDLEQELPPLLGAWPICCGFAANLMRVIEEVTTGEGGTISTGVPLDARLPFPGGDETTPSGG